MLHLIKKQVIELRLDKKLDAFRMQHLVSQHYWKDIIPELEKGFDDLSEADEVIYMDKLEIDLGEVTAMNIEKDKWSSLFVRKVMEKVKERLVIKSGSREMTKEGRALSIARQWIFYMKNGYLPWNAIKVNSSWYDNVLEALATDISTISELRDLIKQELFTPVRIANQHKEDFLVKVTGILTAQNQHILPVAIEELTKILSFIQPSTSSLSPSFKAIKKEIWIKVILAAAKKERSLSSDKIIEIILSDYLKEYPFLEELREALFDELNYTQPALTKLFKKNINPSIQSKITKKNQGEREKNKAWGSSEQKPISKTKEVYQEGIFIQNGGIVLLHPFIHSFFSRLKLVKNGSFTDKSSQQKGIYLLHFLATGKTEAEEYELVIPKVLCAFPIENPVEAGVELSEAEIEEAGDVLTAAILQWEILRNTSIQGFREGFVQRNGKLLTKKDQWYLQIESNSIDILLDHLPWNLSIIKLPWMKDLLRVEWR